MTLLSVELESAGYGRVTVLRDVGFDVAEGGRLVILGGNGAGKTTTLRAISGLCQARGHVRLDGRELMGLATHRIAQAGIAHVPQGRGTIKDLSVRENLLVGATTRTRAEAAEDLERWIERFPRLGERIDQNAAALSGGEQQMLAIARAFMSRPRVVLLDEPSLGLAPKITAEMFASLDEVCRETGVAMVVVEQNADLALDVADDAMVLESGAIVAAGPAELMRGNDDVRRAYLGV
ncbi:ABC transporter ATP-binding protein [Microbacter sp. GSS18]|nr:ABC transporter ATP-binding protein [Microbacter sp. GSS18]